ncbi:MAG: EFR1 family ferrodoxin [Clostridia bacterium]|nr:EFR1 family ferrodoxin [Clostridia bacterium]
MKEIIILYFSATGNTLMVSNELKKYFETDGFGVELVSAEETDKIKNMELKGKLLGIGFPCYGFDYPHAVLDKVLRNLPETNTEVPAFIFSTYCIRPGISMKRLAAKLKDKNITLFCQGGFKCPSAGFISISNGRERGIKKWFMNRVTNFEKRLNDKIILFEKEVIARLQKKPDTNLSNQKIHIFEHIPVHFAEWNERRIFNGYQIDDSKCVKCGMCMKKCPVGNIHSVEDRIEFVDCNECLRCMRCISYCPKNAITLGKKTVGMSRYTHEMQKKLSRHL